MKTNEIRRAFLEFFRERGHTVVPSDSLVPANDPTLLFTSAGMVQFKPYFEAKGWLPYTRAASCQKCFRTPDLERVGHTARHHTFFEMLGNFSFGDYYKQEAIAMGVELVTSQFGLKKEDLWVTYYESDDETANLWKGMGMPSHRIIPRGREDNFWGPVNPEGGVCGPCTEFYVDRGEKFSCGKPTCGFGCDCDRYLEFYNIVFPSWYQDREGRLTKLEKPGVDTGLGLERLASILQAVNSNFDIDVIRPLKERAAALVGAGADETTYRVMADHARAAAFLIADGVLPANEGRGYVLRRIIRRAVRRARQAGAQRLVMSDLVEAVARVMAEPYPELSQRLAFLQQVVRTEEERFLQTLDQGIIRLQEWMRTSRRAAPVISGEEAFKLYDTFGFPLDLTEEIAREAGWQVDREGFERSLQTQQARARRAWKGSGQKAVAHIYHSLREQFGQTNFLGYQSLKAQSRVVAILKDEVPVSALEKKDTGLVILAETPFYGESGGQVGDIGILVWPDGMAEVWDTQKPLPDLIVHKVKLFYGTLREGQEVQALVDVYFRMAAARHHTATHLLQAGLRQILGTHVTQAGSHVSPKRLRFDYTHLSPLTERERYQLEEFLNAAARGAWPVRSAYMTFSEAQRLGALAFFGEKYGEIVRVISIGEVSRELCGGTHVPTTAELGLMKILHEGSVASGIRRIEAVAGDAVMQWGKAHQHLVETLAQKMKTSPHELPQALDKMLRAVRQLEEELKAIRAQSAGAQGRQLMNRVKEVKGIKRLVARVAEPMELETLRSLGDELKGQMGSGVVVLGSASNGRVHLIGMATPDVAGKIKVNEIVKAAAAVMGGSGGGRPQMAQAGGKDPSKLEDALAEVERLLDQAVG